MTGKDTMRAAIVGLRHAHIGRLDPRNPSYGYAHTFKQLAGVRVVAYCEDTDQARLDEARAFDPQARFYTSVDDLLSHEEFELACVALPANEVALVGARLASAGKHFYMEKQFARTSAELAPLVQAVHRNGVKVLAGYPWRFHPAMQDLKQLINAGILGKPLSIETRLVTGQVRPGSRDPGHFFYRRDSEGGGIMHMLGGHFLELMRFLMGCEVRAVQAMIGRPVGIIEAPLEDIAIATFEYENGAYGTIHAGYLLPAIPGRPNYDSCLVYRGELGWATWDAIGAPKLTVTSAAPAWQGATQRAFDYTLTPFNGYGRNRWNHDMMQAFVDAIRAGVHPAVTADDGLHVLQLIDAIYESGRSGRRVEVRYGLDAALEGAAARG